ncbi:MAG: enoyl-CoA hydratase/isomerase family protein [Deltaproteobacteria bacterium]|nr:enoyl-CoA hydratase/isomerase family protein [Deltaproteobacteria bacterium]
MATTPMSDKVLLETTGDTATLTLNRPEEGNAVDLELMLALTERLEEVAAGKDLRVLVIEGRGDHFCSGRQPDVPRPENAAQFAEALGRIVRVNKLLQSFPGISLAVVRGKAFGFGCGLAVQSDVTLAAEDARFAFPEINAGFPPTIVMSYLSRWIHRKKAFELVMTGGEISASEAERQGLVNRVVPADQLEDEKKRWLETLAGRDLDGLQATKAFFRDTAEWSTNAAAQYGVTRLANYFASRS